MHSWTDLIFDISGIKERAEFIEEHGAILPLTHEVSPLEHANLCARFGQGQLGVDGFAWTVWARVPLDPALTITEDGAGQPHPDVDFSTLKSGLDMMLLAAKQATATARDKAEYLATLTSKPAAKKPIPKSKGRRK